MKKIICILSAIIIVLLIVTIIQGMRIKELSKTDSKEKDTSVVNEDSKKYAGIYHANYYSTSGKMMDENIRLNEDSSCKLLYSTNCTWKIKSEKVLSVTTYTFVGGVVEENGVKTTRVFGMKTKEECEKTMVDLNTEGSCEKLDEEHNLDVVNGGIMYNDRVYNKIS